MWYLDVFEMLPKQESGIKGFVFVYISVYVYHIIFSIISAADDLGSSQTYVGK